jgi:hypothetical protein
VVPYAYTFSTYAKGRWVGRQLLDVLCDEFIAETKEYYVCRGFWRTLASFCHGGGPESCGCVNLWTTRLANVQPASQEEAVKQGRITVNGDKVCGTI